MTPGVGTMPIRPEMLSQRRRQKIFDRYVDGMHDIASWRFPDITKEQVADTKMAKRFARFLMLPPYED